jgi:hypothetical protein
VGLFGILIQITDVSTELIIILFIIRLVESPNKSVIARQNKSVLGGKRALDPESNGRFRNKMQEFALVIDQNDVTVVSAYDDTMRVLSPSMAGIVGGHFVV